MSNKTYCQGCHDDYYNRPGNSTEGRCWLLDKAKVVTRYRLDWWTPPTAPGAYTKVETHDCNHAPGQYAMHKELPHFITGEERKRVEAGE